MQASANLLLPGVVSTGLPSHGIDQVNDQETEMLACKEAMVGGLRGNRSRQAAILLSARGTWQRFDISFCEQIRQRLRNHTS